MVTTRCRIFARTAAIFVLASMAQSTLSTATADEPSASGPCAIPATSIALVSQLGGPVPTFGSAVAIDGDWIAVGVPGVDGEAGRVELFHRVDGAWSSHSVVVPSNSAVDDRFGVSLSMVGDLLLVGAGKGTGAQPSTGSAHVFRCLDGRWVEEASLSAPDGAAGDWFGWDVALDGELALVGAYSHDSLGTSSGAAYLFRGDGRRWVLEAKLTASDGMAGDTFGVSVEASGGTLAIGAPLDDLGEVSNAGSVRLFEKVGERWAETNLISPLDSLYPNAAGFFGLQVTLRGETLLAGMRFATPPTSSGTGLAYARDPSTPGWGSPRLVVAPGCSTSGRYSCAMGPTGDCAVWLGESQWSVATATILRRDTGGWTTERRVTFNWPFLNYGLHGSVAVSATDFVVGRSMSSGASSSSGVVYAAKIPPRDRDLDGRDDACEIASGSAEDCDADGIIDDAQIPFRYTADSEPQIPGSLVWHGLGPDGHVLYLNHFVTTGSSGTLRSFGLMKPWLGTLPTTQTAVVYLDPNGDGHPSDAVLLHTQVVTTGGVEQGEIETIPVGPVTIGPDGTSFFIGMAMAYPVTDAFAALDDEWPHRQTSWAVGQSGPINLVDLTLNMPKPLEITGGGAAPWTIRLRADLTDCDDSDRFDSCEIAERVLEDGDGDGVPDMCAPPFGDLDGDGAIGPDDIATLFMHWGPCPDGGGPCLGDLNQDGAVDGTDLGMVLAEW